MRIVVPAVGVMGMILAACTSTSNTVPSTRLAVLSPSRASAQANVAPSIADCSNSSSGPFISGYPFRTIYFSGTASCSVSRPNVSVTVRLYNGSSLWGTAYGSGVGYATGNGTVSVSCPLSGTFTTKTTSNVSSTTSTASSTISC